VKSFVRSTAHDIRVVIDEEITRLDRRLAVLRRIRDEMAQLEDDTPAPRRRAKTLRGRRGPRPTTSPLVERVLAFTKEHPGAKVKALLAAMPDVKKQTLYATVYNLRNTKRLRRTQSLRLP
jgi:hypothetical protein